MFLRKRRLLDQLDAMIEDAQRFLNMWKQLDRSDSELRIHGLKSEIEALEKLRYYIVNNKRWYV